MKRENVKALLANGILQAYAEGKVVEMKHFNKWCTKREYDFSSSPEHYRVKPEPKFSPGDLVKTPGGRVTKVLGPHESGLVLLTGDVLETYRPEHLTPVREVRNPLTFEQAVKLVAEKGTSLMSENGTDVKIIGLERNAVRTERNGYWSYEYAITCNFPDGTPFAAVTYEEIKC